MEREDEYMNAQDDRCKSRGGFGIYSKKTHIKITYEKANCESSKNSCMVLYSRHIDQLFDIKDRGSLHSSRMDYCCQE